MLGKKLLIATLAGTICMSTFMGMLPVLDIAKAATSNQITYQLPPNPEKYLFLNVEMVDILNPQTPAQKLDYVQGDYLLDREGDTYHKLFIDNNLKFQSSKKGFLWNIFYFIGIFPPHFPTNLNLDDLNKRLADPNISWEEKRELEIKRAEIHMNARLQPLVDAGYVKWEEIDEGIATKEFIATVLYRMFNQVRPYHGGIDLKDSKDTAVRWAVEVGLPGFVVDKEGYLYPQSPLSKDPGPTKFVEEEAYDRLFPFLMLIMPGKKSLTGWEYYQIKLKPGMVPVRIQDVIQMNGEPVSPYSDTVRYTPTYQQARKKIDAYFISRFPQMLDQARKDAHKPRAWDWSRDLIHHPEFAKEIAAYRKSKSSKNLNTVYQAVRTHYNLNLRQDSAANIKSVLDNVK